MKVGHDRVAEKFRRICIIYNASSKLLLRFLPCGFIHKKDAGFGQVPNTSLFVIAFWQANIAAVSPPVGSREYLFRQNMIYVQVFC